MSGDLREINSVAAKVRPAYALFLEIIAVYCFITEFDFVIPRILFIAAGMMISQLIFIQDYGHCRIFLALLSFKLLIHPNLSIRLTD